MNILCRRRKITILRKKKKRDSASTSRHVPKSHLTRVSNISFQPQGSNSETNTLLHVYRIPNCSRDAYSWNENQIKKWVNKTENVFKRKVSVYEEINFQRQPSLTFCRLHLNNWVKKVTAGTRQSIKTLGANLGWQSHNVTVAFQWDSEFSCSDRDSEVILIHIIHIYPLSKFFDNSRTHLLGDSSMNYVLSVAHMALLPLLKHPRPCVMNAEQEQPVFAVPCNLREHPGPFLSDSYSPVLSQYNQKVYWCLSPLSPLCFTIFFPFSPRFPSTQ